MLERPRSSCSLGASGASIPQAEKQAAKATVARIRLGVCPRGAPSIAASYRVTLAAAGRRAGRGRPPRLR